VLELKKNIDAISKDMQLYKKLADNKESNYFQLVKILNQISITSKQIENFVNLGLNDWVSKEQQSLESAKAKLTFEFGTALADELSKNGLKLEGIFPDYKVKTFFVAAELQTGKCKLWYGNKEEYLGETALNALVVKKALFTANERITKRDFEDSKFFQKLYKAYENAIVKQHKSVGENVGIISLLLELNFLNQNSNFLNDPRKTSFVEYPREFFSYDLFRLKGRQKDNLTLNLSIATREQNRSRNTYLWVPSDDSIHGNVYSQIAFRRTN